MVKSKKGETETEKHTEEVFDTESNLGFILDFTSPEITANKVKQGTK